MAVAQILADLDATVTRATSVQASAAALIRGIGARIQAAVTAALANGATAEELEPIRTLAAALDTSATDLSDAVIENTPAEA